MEFTAILKQVRINKTEAGNPQQLLQVGAKEVTVLFDLEGVGEESDMEVE